MDKPHNHLKHAHEVLEISSTHGMKETRQKKIIRIVGIITIAILLLGFILPFLALKA